MDKVVNIKVVGVGGAGYSIVSRMIASGIGGVAYVTIDSCTKTATPMALAPVPNRKLEKRQHMTHAVRSKHF